MLRYLKGEIMRQSYDDVLRVRIPSALSERLRATANQFARSPSDVVREAVVVQLDRLARRIPGQDMHPPEAA